MAKSWSPDVLTLCETASLLVATPGDGELIDEQLGLRYVPNTPERSTGMARIRLADWLHWWIQYLAYGADAADQPPLCCQDEHDKKGCETTLKVVSTNLSLEEPESIPNTHTQYYARRSELNALFPETVVEALIGARLAAEPSETCYLMNLARRPVPTTCTF